MVQKIHLNLNCASAGTAQTSTKKLLLHDQNPVAFDPWEITSFPENFIQIQSELFQKKTNRRCHITSEVIHLYLVNFKFEPIKMKVKNIHELLKGPTISQVKIPSRP